MSDAMSKKEKLARGSAVIKVQKVTPRPGHFLKNYVDVYKMPRKPKPALPPGVKKPPEALADMPHLDIRAALFEINPISARIAVQQDVPPPPKAGSSADPCAAEGIEDPDLIDPKTLGLPDGHVLLSQFGYREWAKTVYPPEDGNIAEHFNILIGLLISMSRDPENENFPDVEAYPCVQFLRTIKTPDGEVPYNIGSYIEYIEFIANKIVEEA